MPTPIGHALGGLVVAQRSGGAQPLRTSHIALLVFCAVAPDLDLLPGLIDGVNHHRGASHSIGAAILVGLLGFAARRLGLDVPGGFAMGAAWASHVLLDYLGLDTSPPSGEMALWPLSNAFFVSPIPVFYDVRRAFTQAAIEHNLIAVAIEVLVLGPIVLMTRRRTR